MSGLIVSSSLAFKVETIYKRHCGIVHSEECAACGADHLTVGFVVECVVLQPVASGAGGELHHPVLALAERCAPAEAQTSAKCRGIAVMVLIAPFRR